MQVELYKGFVKRKNSTKQPTNINPVVKNVNLKGECSVLNPSFFIADADSYTYLKAWGNYYFIDRVAYDINGAQYIDCTIDVLASYKAAIQGTTAFVDYSSSDYSENLLDTRVSQLVTKNWVRTATASIFVNGFNEGCYILTTANVEHGPVSYIMNRANLEALIMDLIEVSPTEVSNWQELFGDAMGSVIGLRYIPIAYSYFPSASQEDVRLGGWNSGYPGLVHDGNITHNVSIDIPWRYSDYRRCSEFTRFALALPFIGLVDIKAETLIGYNSITVQMVGNCVTGNISYNIYLGETTTNKIIATYSATFGRQLPVAQGQVDLTGILNSGVVAGGAWLGALAGFTNPAVGVAAIGGAAIHAVISANQQDFSVIGGYSGGYGEVLINNYEFYSITNDSRIEPSSLTALFGRPCKKVTALTNLTGYVQTVGFSIAVEAIAEVRNMINKAMDSGVYLE